MIRLGLRRARVKAASDACRMYGEGIVEMDGTSKLGSNAAVCEAKTEGHVRIKNFGLDAHS